MDYKVVTFGEILWDNLPEGRRLGGAPLNVCYHLIKMGVPSIFISQVGNDPDGSDIRKALLRLGINDRYCYTAVDKPTSTVEVRLSSSLQVSYEILDNVAWDAIQCLNEMEQLVSGSEAFVYGSLVARMAISRSTLLRLLQVAKYKVFDLNLREPFFDKELILDLMSYAQLLKLNDDELSIIVQWLQIKETNTTDQLHAILEKFSNIKEILLTKGALGAVYYSRENEFQVDALKINVQDTVGSGDSFLAAFLAEKFHQKSIPDSLQKAVLLSGFVSTQKGACPEYDDDMVEEFKLAILRLPAAEFCNSNEIKSAD